MTKRALLALALCAACGTTPGQPSTVTETTTPPATTTVSAPAPGTTSPAARHTTAPPSPATTTAPASTAATRTVTVTEDDNGRTVRLHPGDRLHVTLRQDWQPPTSDADHLVRTSSTGGYPTGKPVDTTFEARSDGTGHVATQTDFACFHSTPRCLRPTEMWRVTVVVS